MSNKTNLLKATTPIKKIIEASLVHEKRAIPVKIKTHFIIYQSITETESLPKDRTIRIRNTRPKTESATISTKNIKTTT